MDGQTALARSHACTHLNPAHVGEGDREAEAFGCDAHVELVGVGDEGFDDEGVDDARASVHLDALAAARLDEGLGFLDGEVEADEVVLPALAEETVRLHDEPSAVAGRELAIHAGGKVEPRHGGRPQAREELAAVQLEQPFGRRLAHLLHRHDRSILSSPLLSSPLLFSRVRACVRACVRAPNSVAAPRLCARTSKGSAAEGDARAREVVPREKSA